ncbi:hypothetical protein BGZ74_011279, partial [Mortierella antarctica]
MTPEMATFLYRIKEDDQVEVTGKWTTYTSKDGKSTTNFILEKVKPADLSKEGISPDLPDLPIEKQYNFDESEDALMLKKLTYQSEIAKLDRRKAIKTRKLTTSVDDDASESEDRR